MTKVLFVCMGNICRSPTAEGVFTALVEQAKAGDRIHIDSAGTHAYHVGEPPDRRAQDAAMRRGIDLSAQRARRVSPSDFEEYDVILAMDEDNVMHLQTVCAAEHQEKIRLLMDYAPEFGIREVPDPYYGGDSGFERVLDMVQAASQNLLDELLRRR